MAIVKRTFSVTTSGGTRFYRAGKPVPDDLAKKFPHFMEGWRDGQAAHNPNLPAKLSNKIAEKMGEPELVQWLQQFHPGNVPAGKASREELLEIVKDINQI